MENKTIKDMATFLCDNSNWEIERIEKNSVVFWIPWNDCGVWKNLDEARKDSIYMDDLERVLWEYSKEDIIELYKENISHQ